MLFSENGVGCHVSSGTYTLVIDLAEDTDLEFGAAGEYALQQGLYTYTGSAAHESFSRVDRHRTLADGESDVRHWHIDYLLGHDATTIVGVVRTEEAVECPIAREIASHLTEIGGLGASDYTCVSHLHYAQYPQEKTFELVQSAYDSVTDSWTSVGRNTR